MNDVRLNKQLFYRELQLGRRPRHEFKGGFKDIVKNNLRK